MDKIGVISALLSASHSNSIGHQGNVTVGFGTAALGDQNYDVVTMALDAGFRIFDTAEADWWYNQAEVGRALQDYYFVHDSNSCEGLEISTKIGPWSLTSADDIRQHAANSRQELLGFCPNLVLHSKEEEEEEEHEEDDISIPFPLDTYYIHAPACWRGWHYRCDNPPPTLNLRDAWMAMEQVAGIDFSAKRIGLSNVHPDELLDIIHFAQERSRNGDPIARIPDVLQAYADPLRPAEALRQICDDYGIEFVSYSTLGTQHRQPSNRNPVLTSPIVVELAEKHQRSVAEVVLSWALQNNMSIIPRSSKKHHIQELARLINEPPFLDDHDLEKMNSMNYDAQAEL